MRGVDSLYKKPPYDSVADFLPLSLVVELPRAMITPTNFPANSLPEFITYIKANQATAKFGSAGAGSASHVSCILLNAALGVSITHVPYRGLGPAMQDLIAGRIDYMCDSPSTSLPQIEANLVKAIATTGQQRSASLPNVPTAQEQGLNFDVNSWQGFSCRRARRSRSYAVSLRQSVRHWIHRRYASVSKPSARSVIPPERRGPEYFAKFVAEEIERWAGPIKASGVSID